MGTEISKVPVEDLPAPAAAAAVLAAKPQFKAVAGIVERLDVASKPAAGLSALVGLLEHVARLKLLPLLSTSIQVRHRSAYRCQSCQVISRAFA